jgi:hypothetical protein
MQQQHYRHTRATITQAKDFTLIFGRIRVFDI